MRWPKAILFDLDDTIITGGERLPVLVQVAEEFALHLRDHDPQQVGERLEGALQRFWSMPAQAKVARLGAAFGVRQARESVMIEEFHQMGLDADLARRVCDRFSALRQMSAHLFDGARETIEKLRGEGIRLALVTNGAADVQRAKLARFSLAALFDHVQIEGEYGFGKPEHRAYLHAMEVLASRPSETWMVGDHLEWEVRAPQQLGIHAIWHDHLGRGLPSNSTVRPDRIITRLPDLVAPVPVMNRR